MSLVSDPSTNVALHPRKNRHHHHHPSLSSQHHNRVTTELLCLPDGCEVVANTFLIFKWPPSTLFSSSFSPSPLQQSCCLLQTNLTLYCWGGRRSGALEHALIRYGLTTEPSSPQYLYRINSRQVTHEQWTWLKQIFMTVHRMFNDEEVVCDTISKIHWLNVMDCRLVYAFLRQECYYYHRHLYPAGSSLNGYLKQHGLEVEPWYYSLTDDDEEEKKSGVRQLNTNTQQQQLLFPVASSSAHGTTNSSILSHHEPSSSSLLLVLSDSALPSPPPPTVAALGDYEWLSDVHIANLMFLLIHGQIPIPLEYRDCFQFLYPMTDDIFIQMLHRHAERRHEEEKEDESSSSSSLLMHAINGQGITFVFINPHNNHWRVLIVDGTETEHSILRVLFFDPLGSPLPSSLSSALTHLMEVLHVSFQLVDLQLCLQAESWNCGIWSLYIASRYLIAIMDHLITVPLNVDSEEISSSSSSSSMDFKDLLMRSPPVDVTDPGFMALDNESSDSQRDQNKAFANDLRRQYSALLEDADANRRLLYSSEYVDRDPLDKDTVDQRQEHEDDEYRNQDITPPSLSSLRASPTISSNSNDNNNHREMNMVIAGSANSVVRSRHRYSIKNRPASDYIWIDITEDVILSGGMNNIENDTKEAEDHIEDSYDDIWDHFIEFRDDNINNSSAASLRYSLPIKLQSNVLKQQIEAFRLYRRQRFSLFRKGPLVEETTISSNISCLIRFLGYLYYEQKSIVDEHNNGLFDMSVFALPTINYLILDYVQWLEQRRGSKRTSSSTTSTTFQTVSSSTVANYLNGLVSVVKYQLQYDIYQRDALLDQLRNLRSQAESYSMTQKKFEKVHPEWCSWQELQLAREKCRAIFHSQPTEAYDDALSVAKRKAHLLQLREVVLLCLFTICPPPRCSIIRLLEWNKTLVRVIHQKEEEEWVIDLTDLSHAATRHKTHKRKGAMQLPLSRLLYPYLNDLYALNNTSNTPNSGIHTDMVFPATIKTRRAGRASSSFMDSTAFGVFVKNTFYKYTSNQKAPNPSLLRSIFTTWLYSLRYDTEDSFLQQIKASSAKWKAHSEHIAATVYNKELVYQKKEFTHLLQFCELYAQQFSSSCSKHSNTGLASSLLDQQYEQSSSGSGAKNDDDKEEEETEHESTDTDSEMNDVDVDETSNKRRNKKTKNKKKHVIQTNTRSKRSKNIASEEDDSMEVTEQQQQQQQYVVDKLVSIRVTKQGEKQVSVKWEGYTRLTWEPYLSIRSQLPEMMTSLEQELSLSLATTSLSSQATINVNTLLDHDQIVRKFLTEYIIRHHITTAKSRWSSEELNALEYAAMTYSRPINETTDQLRKKIVCLVKGTSPS